MTSAIRNWLDAKNITITYGKHTTFRPDYIRDWPGEYFHNYDISFFASKAILFMLAKYPREGLPVQLQESVDRLVQGFWLMPNSLNMVVPVSEFDMAIEVDMTSFPVPYNHAFFTTIKQDNRLGTWKGLDIVPELVGNWHRRKLKGLIIYTKFPIEGTVEVANKLHPQVPFLFYTSSRIYYLVESAIEASLNFPIPFPVDLRPTPHIYESFPPYTPYRDCQVDNLVGILKSGFKYKNFTIRYDGIWYIDDAPLGDSSQFYIWTRDHRALTDMGKMVIYLLQIREEKYLMSRAIMEERYGYTDSTELVEAKNTKLTIYGSMPKAVKMPNWAPLVLQRE